MNKLKHFIDCNDLSQKEVFEIFDLMRMLKKARYNGAVPELLKNKTLAMIFEEPSTRTRVSFEAAMTLLGGHAQYLKPGDIHLGSKESFYDTAKVLSRMCDGIFCRAYEHKTLLGLAKYAEVPVFNGITDYNHPTQAICDAFTMLEHLPQTKLKNLNDVKVVFIGDRTNVCSSTMHICTQLGMNFTHIAPTKYQSPKEWLDIANCHIKKYGGSVKVTDDINAVIGADIIYTDLWWWFGQESEAEERYKTFKEGGYQVNNKLLEKAGEQAKVMHCLPCARNNELADDAFDGLQSIVFDQSENRLTAQLALLVYFMYPQIDKATDAMKLYWKGKIENFMGDQDRSWNQRRFYNNDYDPAFKIDYLTDIENSKKKG
ncbi:MAG: ornithine carbamoyltransferase [Mycoplasmoidaceae bacterium]